MRAYIYKCIHTYHDSDDDDLRMHAAICRAMYACMYVCMCVYVCVCMYVCMYICVCVY